MTTSRDPGLPGDGIDNRKKRHAKQFTLPRSIAASSEWKTSALPEADLTFVLAEPTTADEENARKFAKGDPIKYSDRLLEICTIKIGNEMTHMNHARITGWQDAIGPKGRKLVEGKWMECYQVSAEEAAEMDATEKEVFV